ncbi:MAG: hypothetical protein EOM03_19260 [Clostridia bacterium]|nr:hypothetical protein [Clostridia bacterium]
MSYSKRAIERFDEVVVQSSGHQVREEIQLELICECIDLVLRGQAVLKETESDSNDILLDRAAGNH